MSAPLNPAWALRSQRLEPHEGHPPREQWGDGPWQAEPDLVEWRHRGLPCLIVRSDSTGALCGYVGLPPGHPLHGAHYDAPNVQVHGGLTYSASCREGGHICHQPLEGESPHVWWLGFDCGHAFDVMPALGALMSQVAQRRELFPEEQYRDLEYVRGQVESLAAQLCVAEVQS
jgi:hypothetical protein